MAPSAAVVTLRAGAFTFALAFGDFVSFASFGYVSWPEVAVDAPPVAVLIEVPLKVTVRILLLTVAVNAADFLVYVV